MIITPLHGAGYLGENVFILTDEATGMNAVIDPCFEKGLSGLERLPLSLILLTHGHFDHIAHADALRKKTGAQILLMRDESAVVLLPQNNLSTLFGAELSLVADRPLWDAEHIELGCSNIQVIHTPGHTVGSCCYLVDGHLFTGDTVMAGSVGRCDLPTGNSDDLAASIRRLCDLPGDYTLHCGHGPDTTLQKERDTNPFFKGGNR